MNYNHININERSCIYQFLTLGMSIRGIAKALHRSPSTISREIKRNSYRAWSNFKEHDRYFPGVLQLERSRIQILLFFS